MITTRGMSPFALMLVEPYIEGSKTPPRHTNYQFYDIVVNDPWSPFHSNPFVPFTPRAGCSSPTPRC